MAGKGSTTDSTRTVDLAGHGALGYFFDGYFVVARRQDAYRLRRQPAFMLPAKDVEEGSPFVSRNFSRFHFQHQEKNSGAQ
jgi:hypothetical protein